MKINLHQYPNLQIEGLLPRDVWVWTPPQYDLDPEARFPVIYMHDGQNLFIPEKSYTHVTWGVAETITKLSNWGFIRPVIVVGIDNTENRFGDYIPTRPFETPEGEAYLEKIKQEAPEEFESTRFVADQYLKLIVDEVKPRVDGDFRTLSDLKNTFMMGSSLGGLISLYALVEFPHIFGGAGCFSTHWPVLDKLTRPYLQAYLPGAGKHRIYFDHGTVDLDAAYQPFQQEVNEIMHQKGYNFGKDWLTRVAPGAFHHEQAWRDRLHIALRFLLGIYAV